MFYDIVFSEGGGTKWNSILCTEQAPLYYDILSDSLHECFMCRKMQSVRYGLLHLS